MGVRSSGGRVGASAMWRFVCIVTLLFLYVRAADRPPPVIPSAFTSRLSVSTSATTTTEGTYRKNDEKEEMQMSTVTVASFSPGYPLNSTTFLTNGVKYALVNGACHNLGQVPYTSYFRWVSISQYNGTAIVNGVECDWWTRGTLAVCVTDDDIPVQLLVGGDTPNVIQFDFYNVTIGAAEVTVPQLCAPKALDFACGEGEVEEYSFLRFHGDGQFELENKNVADLMGDTVFICTSAIFDTRPDSNSITWWKVAVNSTWGRYAFCNNGACLGGSEELVGREAANGLFPVLAGQCNSSTTLTTGTWFSLPASARCASGIPTPGVCAWGAAVRAKTISLECLVGEHDFGRICEADGAVPFTRSAEVLLRAFHESDPKRGGCPDTGGPRTDPSAGRTKEALSIDYEERIQAHWLSLLSLGGQL